MRIVHFQFFTKSVTWISQGMSDLEQKYNVLITCARGLSENNKIYVMTQEKCETSSTLLWICCYFYSLLNLARTFGSTGIETKTNLKYCFSFYFKKKIKERRMVGNCKAGFGD